ncbi:Plasmodium exported protein (PHISTa), unknown, putative [Plasmodium sp.]|nr:Plasmodium exported protein (PHISTa), unknown, putative [Plasmodium sp.]SOV84209.1 Plasmodium exported protein (PHISTa), unknown, putative [Plasmodium sp.]
MDCTIFPFYHNNENNKGKLHYISFKFLCLCLYIIGFIYVFLDRSLENNSLEIVKSCNIYKRNLVEAEKSNKGSKRKRKLKNKKEDVNKTKNNDNNIKCNEQKVEEKKYSTNNYLGNTKVENKSNSSVSNINYNDMSRNLKEKELLDVLSSLEECPPKEDLRNLWNHTIGVAKEDFDDIQKDLKGSIQKYLDNSINEGSQNNLYDNIWERNLWRFCRTVGTEELEYTNKFFNLVNSKHTLDDILKFIYSFLEYFNKLKKELYEKHQKELLQEMEQTFHLWKYRYKFK